jgi:hypothetical protein
MASAAAAGALKRKRAGHDPVSLGVRVAAALNAEDRPDRWQYNFHWATAVTAEGQILVANSYGLGYLPDGQNLPEQVRFVSLDTGVPLSKRVSWSTYPWRALLGWAQHHQTDLRTVIGTAEQLAGVDLGCHHTVLEPDDIPPSSAMPGNGRLAIIAPAAASRLSRISDAALIAMLPAAPADTTPPLDRRIELWSEVVMGIMTQASDRHLIQLEALLEYACHCEQLAIFEGHTASDATAQRAAVGNGLYWHHLAVLITEALDTRNLGPH